MSLKRRGKTILFSNKALTAIVMALLLIAAVAVHSYADAGNDSGSVNRIEAADGEEQYSEKSIVSDTKELAEEETVTEEATEKKVTLVPTVSDTVLEKSGKKVYIECGAESTDAAKERKQKEKDEHAAKQSAAKTETKQTETKKTETVTEAPAVQAVTEAPAAQPVAETPAAEVATEAPAAQPVAEAPAAPAVETPAPSGCLTPYAGVFNGPSGRETYYNLDMSGVVSIMRGMGFDEENYPYWVRDDGCKMLGPYIMVAADLDIRPRGSLIQCSLGTAIVCDTGGFIYSYPTGLDIATNW